MFLWYSYPFFLFFFFFSLVGTTGCICVECFFWSAGGIRFLGRTYRLIHITLSIWMVLSSV